MTTTDGWLHDKGGSNLMLFGEAAAAVVAAALFAVLVVATRRTRLAQAAAPQA